MYISRGVLVAIVGSVRTDDNAAVAGHSFLDQFIIGNQI